MLAVDGHAKFTRDLRKLFTPRRRPSQTPPRSSARRLFVEVPDAVDAGSSSREELRAANSTAESTPAKATAANSNQRDRNLHQESGIGSNILKSEGNVLESDVISGADDGVEGSYFWCGLRPAHHSHAFLCMHLPLARNSSIRMHA